MVTLRSILNREGSARPTAANSSSSAMAPISILLNHFMASPSEVGYAETYS
jgi:hypothetical protein